MQIALLALLLLQAPSPVLENDFVQVFKNSAPCAAAGPTCGERIIVALGPVEFGGRKMGRGDIKVFKKGERYSPPVGGDYVEVVMKPVRPAVKTPPVAIPPEKNSILYQGERFFIFEEKLQPGDTRARHSHAQRLIIVLNATQLQQWPEGQPELIAEEIPDDIHFSQPVVHITKTVGKIPLRNIVIELKP